MTQKRLSLQFILLVLVLGGFFFVVNPEPMPTGLRPVVATSSQVSAGAVATIASTTTSVATSTAPAKPEQKPTEVKKPTPTTTPVVATTTSITEAPKSDEVERVENAYSTPPLPFTAVNIAARAALVNILCMPKSGGMSPISGSGVIVNPRGVILTNAHVAQYVLLAQSNKIDFSCYVRTGSPAVIRWIPRVMYIPSVWVEGHAADITSPHPVGTGEHDYALLFIAQSYDATPLPTSFPFISPDTREAIGFVDDQVIVASYPAEFAGGSLGFSLYPASSITAITQLLTFTTKSIDVISVGGVIGAQSGSSGGAIVNAWNKLVGIITTTSDGATTADRDLRSITLSYINRDITVQTGRNLASWLTANPLSQSVDFAKGDGPRLLDLLLKEIIK